MAPSILGNIRFYTIIRTQYFVHRFVLFIISLLHYFIILHYYITL
jgi:hypothetical protein